MSSSKNIRDSLGGSSDEEDENVQVFRNRQPQRPVKAVKASKNVLGNSSSSEEEEQEEEEHTPQPMLGKALGAHIAQRDGDGDAQIDGDEEGDVEEGNVEEGNVEEGNGEDEIVDDDQHDDHVDVSSNNNNVVDDDEEHDEHDDDDVYSENVQNREIDDHDHDDDHDDDDENDDEDHETDNSHVDDEDSHGQVLSRSGENPTTVLLLHDESGDAINLREICLFPITSLEQEINEKLRRWNVEPKDMTMADEDVIGCLEAVDLYMKSEDSTFLLDFVGLLKRSAFLVMNRYGTMATGMCQQLKNTTEILEHSKETSDNFELKRRDYSDKIAELEKKLGDQDRMWKQKYDKARLDLEDVENEMELQKNSAPRQTMSNEKTLDQNENADNAGLDKSAFLSQQQLILLEAENTRLRTELENLLSHQTTENGGDDENADAGLLETKLSAANEMINNLQQNNFQASETVKELNILLGEQRDVEQELRNQLAEADVNQQSLLAAIERLQQQQQTTQATLDDFETLEKPQETAPEETAEETADLGETETEANNNVQIQVRAKILDADTLDAIEYQGFRTREELQIDMPTEIKILKEERQPKEKSSEVNIQVEPQPVEEVLEAAATVPSATAPVEAAPVEAAPVAVVAVDMLKEIVKASTSSSSSSSSAQKTTDVFPGNIITDETIMKVGDKEIHLHVHSHQHTHNHVHTHQHDHYHQYGVTSKILTKTSQMHMEESTEQATKHSSLINAPAVMSTIPATATLSVGITKRSKKSTKKDPSEQSSTVVSSINIKH